MKPESWGKSVGELDIDELQEQIDYLKSMKKVGTGNVYVRLGALEREIEARNKPRTADVCVRCPYIETCKENCEAYMTLARMSINLESYLLDWDKWVNGIQDTHFEQAEPRNYIDDLQEEIHDLVVVSK